LADSTHTNVDFERRRAETLRVLGNYQKFSSLSREQVDHSSRTALRGFIAWATRHSIWWQNTLGKDFLEKTRELSLGQTLQAIPTLSKTQARANATSMQVWVPGSDRSQYQVHSTSGTTGQPMQVRKYIPYYVVRHYAARLLDSVWQKRDLATPMVFLSTQRQAERHSKVGEPFSYLGETGPYEIKNIAKQTPSEILETLVQSKAPQVSLNGFVLGLLLSEKKASPAIKVRVSEFMTFADQISQTTRDQAKDLFGAKVTDRYSCEEFGFLALQCPALEHLHTLPFTNLIEIVDEQGAPCPPGVPGRVLVTSLSNLATPMFRYELGDYAQWGEPCSAGISFPVLEPVITRVRESLVDEDGVAFRPTTNKAQFLNFQELTDFQFYLLSDAIVVLAAVRASLTKEKLDIFEQDAAKMFRSKLPVHIIQVAELAWLGTWKRKSFVQSDAKYSPQMDVAFFRSISS
jgi:phenylacetate-CoA ligase